MAHQRYQPRQGLSIGDGFRIGFGIFLFQLVAFAIVFFLMLAGGLMVNV